MAHLLKPTAVLAGRVLYLKMCLKLIEDENWTVKIQVRKATPPGKNGALSQCHLKSKEVIHIFSDFFEWCLCNLSSSSANQIIYSLTIRLESNLSLSNILASLLISISY